MTTSSTAAVGPKTILSRSPPLASKSGTSDERKRGMNNAYHSDITGLSHSRATNVGEFPTKGN